MGVEERHASERLERSDHTVDLFAHVFRDEITRADGGADNAQALVGERHRLWNARGARLGGRDGLSERYVKQGMRLISVSPQLRFVHIHQLFRIQHTLF